MMSSSTVVIALVGVSLSFLLNVVLVAYQWWKLHQIVSDLKSVVDKLGNSLEKTIDLTGNHAVRIGKLETHFQHARRGDDSDV